MRIAHSRHLQRNERYPGDLQLGAPDKRGDQGQLQRLAAMSTTVKLGGAAIVGAVAGYLLKGDNSRKAKGQCIASAFVGWAIAVIVSHLVPQLHFAPVDVQLGLGCLCSSLTAYGYARLSGLDITVKLPGGSQIKSKGTDDE